MAKAKKPQKKAAKRRDWEKIVEGLAIGKTKKFALSTPGVASVTRVRLLKAYEGLEATTKMNVLILRAV